MVVNLDKLIENFAGKWIAYDQRSDNLLASGENAKTVYEIASKKIDHTPTLFKVPSSSTPYIG